MSQPKKNTHIDESRRMLAVIIWQEVKKTKESVPSLAKRMKIGQASLYSVLSGRDGLSMERWKKVIKVLPDLKDAAEQRPGAPVNVGVQVSAVGIERYEKLRSAGQDQMFREDPDHKRTSTKGSPTNRSGKPTAKKAQVPRLPELDALIFDALWLVQPGNLQHLQRLADRFGNISLNELLEKISSMMAVRPPAQLDW